MAGRITSGPYGHIIDGKLQPEAAGVCLVEDLLQMEEHVYWECLPGEEGESEPADALAPCVGPAMVEGSFVRRLLAASDPTNPYRFVRAVWGPAGCGCGTSGCNCPICGKFAFPLIIAVRRDYTVRVFNVSPDDYWRLQSEGK